MGAESLRTVRWPRAPRAQRLALDAAAEVLDRGGLVAFPTDTVYGLAARADLPAALKRLYMAKGRPSEKAVALLVADVQTAKELAAEWPEEAARLSASFWPGALTLVVPARDPEVAGDRATIGIRMPRHPVALALIRRAGGALATTSANLSGRESCFDAECVKLQLGERVDLLIDGGRCPLGIDSTVVDVTSRPCRVLRRGAIEIEAPESVVGLMDKETAQ